MNRINIFLLFFFFDFLLLTGCSSYKVLTIGDAKEVRFDYFNNGKLGLEVDIPISNTGNVDFKVKKVELSVKLNSFAAGEVINVEKVKIKKKSEQVYTFPVEVEINGLSNSAMILLSIVSQRNLSIEVDGFIKVKYIFISKKIPVRLTEKIRIY